MREILFWGAHVNEAPPWLAASGKYFENMESLIVGNGIFRVFYTLYTQVLVAFIYIKQNHIVEYPRGCM